MAQKNNIRSIRFSDELAELIDRQVGDTFTAKFEGLVTRCVWELPQKEAELKRLEQRIQERQKHLDGILEQTHELSATLRNLTGKTLTLESAINQELKNWTK